ncbi:DNA internalization-related competence protein ComEC/Rec2 [Cysteiniphilum sp. 6C5]|uniref:DNA internalization-related competence protein ComEC/Rec2 n=1 Tax=unclassified Cysteiniphilum TaxID=2610889 RepID=UPI003F82DD37
MHKRLGFSLITLLSLLITIHGLWVLYGYGQKYPENQLNKKIMIEGVVASLVDRDKAVSKFLFATKDGLIRLSVYPNKNLRPWQLTPGSRWRLHVKLQTAKGFSNPGVFNYANWLKRQRIKAVGYVVTTEKAKFRGIDYGYFVERLRYKIERILQKTIKDTQLRALASALLIGNKNELTLDDKRLFQQTGTSHLIAISGLHIGMIALFAFCLLRFLWSCSVRLCQWLPAQKAGLIAAAISAFSYSLLAGFAIPTERAFIMVLVFSVGLLINRKINSFYLLLLAGVIIVLWQPLSLFEPGFWLSFMAVFFLIVINRILLSLTKFKRYLLIQLLLMVLLIPLTIFWFQGFSMVGVIANLVAIPWVSFLVVPSLFINLMLSLFGVDFWFISAYLIKLLVLWLNLLPVEMLFFYWHSISTLAVISAVTGLTLLLFPLPWYLRILSVVLFLPIFQKERLASDVAFKMTVLDVGQGLAIVIQTPETVVVYDTAGSNGKKFVIAEHTLIPYLKHQGIHHIDTLIISHQDKDHSGGLSHVINEFTVTNVFSNEVIGEVNAKICQDGLQWQVHAVSFKFLTANHLKGNNGSCVLKVSSNDQSVLLTGDIYKTAERYLFNNHRTLLPSTILLAPHHGSSSSSSTAFIEAVEPKYVIFSSGKHDGFKHPHSEVVQKYQAAGIKILNTAQNGAITAIFKDNGELVIKTNKTEED